MTVGQRKRLVEIKRIACAHADCDWDAITSAARMQWLANVRHAVMFCLERYVGMTHLEISQTMQRERSSVTSAMTRIGGLIDRDCCPVVIQDVVDQVRKELGVGQRAEAV